MNSPTTIVLRALTLRCVACGGRPVLVSWFREAPNCPRCGFQLDRAEDGYWLGSYTTNLSLTLLILTVGIVVAIIVEWPAVNWGGITFWGIVSAIGIPLLIFPWTKTLYLALDVIFRPPEENDFNAPVEPGLNEKSLKSLKGLKGLKGENGLETPEAL